jgi:hypothetical protein
MASAHSGLVAANYRLAVAGATRHMSYFRLNGYVSLATREGQGGGRPGVDAGRCKNCMYFIVMKQKALPPWPGGASA